jgi:hypothetical protein
MVGAKRSLTLEMVTTLPTSSNRMKGWIGSRTEIGLMLVAFARGEFGCELLRSEAV